MIEKTFKHDGVEYKFSEHHIKDGKIPALPAKSGVYVLGKDDKGKIEPLYIGQSVDMAKRIGNHEKLADALAKGANVILTVEAPEAQIANIENELVSKYNPPLQQHRK